MSRFTTRSRGIAVKVMDLSGLKEEALKWRQETKPDCYEVRIYGGPWAIVRKNEQLFAICKEGVGYEVTDSDPLELEFHGSYWVRDEAGEIQPNKHSFDTWPFASVTLTPEELVDAQIEEEVDLADFIRVFGDRLETNFWNWFEELS